MFGRYLVSKNVMNYLLDTEERYEALRVAGRAVVLASGRARTLQPGSGEDTSATILDWMQALDQLENLVL